MATAMRSLCMLHSYMASDIMGFNCESFPALLGLDGGFVSRGRGFAEKRLTELFIRTLAQRTWEDQCRFPSFLAAGQLCRFLGLEWVDSGWVMLAYRVLTPAPCSVVRSVGSSLHRFWQEILSAVLQSYPRMRRMLRLP